LSWHVKYFSSKNALQSFELKFIAL
jgi:hypothetical protein